MLRVWRVLPPRQNFEAISQRITLAPARAAAMAAHSAALPPPATSTSYLRERSAIAGELPGAADGSISGAPEGIRTPDLCLRRAALYPAELRARMPLP